MELPLVSSSSYAPRSNVCGIRINCPALETYSSSETKDCINTINRGKRKQNDISARRVTFIRSNIMSPLDFLEKNLRLTHSPPYEYMLFCPRRFATKLDEVTRIRPKMHLKRLTAVE